MPTEVESQRPRGSGAAGKTSIKTPLQDPRGYGASKTHRPTSVPRRNQDPASPSFLRPDGTWELGVTTQTLPPRSSTATQLPNGRNIRPVLAYHTYKDASPVVSKEHIQEIQVSPSFKGDGASTNDLGATSVPPASKFLPPGATQPPNSFYKGPLPLGASLTRVTSAYVPDYYPPGNPSQSMVKPHKMDNTLHYMQQRSGALDLEVHGNTTAWWAAPGEGPLGFDDTGRYLPLGTERLLKASIVAKDVKDKFELSRAVVPSSANTKLVGGRWRYMPEKADGDVVYTDFYGRCGSDPASYYGRTYDLQTKEMNQTRLVEDSRYKREQASMPGINTLRHQPGMAMDATMTNVGEHMAQNAPRDMAGTIRLRP